MTGPVFSPLSVQDLDGIVEYIGCDSPRAALSFIETLKAKCDMWIPAVPRRPAELPNEEETA